MRRGPPGLDPGGIKVDLEIKTREDNQLPPLIRGGRTAVETEETKQILSALQSGKVCQIEGVSEDRQYNNLQQRIRTIARRYGLNVTIRRSRSDSLLAFQGQEEVDEKEADKSAVVSDKPMTTTSDNTSRKKGTPVKTK